MKKKDVGQNKHTFIIKSNRDKRRRRKRRTVLFLLLCMRYIQQIFSQILIEQTKDWRFKIEEIMIEK